jgi:hypothetical protein
MPQATQNANETALSLLAYCRTNDWAGIDPYDALNSKIFTMLPFLNCRLPRLVMTQVLKRSPLNIRSLLFIPKTQNPKALGVFLSALVKLDRLGLLEDKSLVAAMVENIARQRSADDSYWCWGYSFPWQTRTLIVPRSAPSLVCTVFVGEALLDAYEHSSDEECLRMALSAAGYIRDKLYWAAGDSEAGLRYPTPSSDARIHNANLLGAAFLARASRLGREKSFLEPAWRLARYSAGRQQADGSWPYGESPTQRWIDNFHTGYNLCALRQTGRRLGTTEFEPIVERGYKFYVGHFFREDGAPRYFHNRNYPVDGHCVAQSIITLLAFKDLWVDSVDLARRVFGWAATHMWDERGSYFYYRVLPGWTIKTSYMRWVQAWMLLAISTLLLEDTAPRRVGDAQPMTSCV